MPDRPDKEPSELIREEAAQWLVCLREGTLSFDDRLKYVQWLKRSPVHVRAMLELAALEGQLRCSDLSEMTPALAKAASPDAVTVVDFDPRRDTFETSCEGRRWSSWKHWRGAASACLSRVEVARRAISRFVRTSH